MSKDHSIEGTMAHAQYKAIQSSLRDNGYNLTMSARQLRIGRTTLYRLLHLYDVKLDEEARRAGGTRRRRGRNGPESRISLIDGNWYLIEDQKTALEVSQ